VTWLRPLLSSPSPLIGEIGLDKPAAKKDLKYVLASPLYPPLPPAAKQLLSPLHAQVAAFSAQLVLCGERRGLCSVHSVKASPYVAALLRYFFAGEGARARPRGVVMHSFSGDREDYRELREFEGESGVRVYFGYSKAVSGRSRSRDVWEEVSRDRVLLESDAVDERGQTRALVEGVREIGRIWGEGDMEVVEAVNRNWEECGGLVEGAIALT
jgi:Tat protein secretion system quality control protein TatD with DNase activity